MIRGELRDPPAPPVSARTAALRVEQTTAEPIRHGRRRRRPPRISWRSIAVLFLPYTVLAACIVAAVLLTRGATQ